MAARCGPAQLSRVTSKAIKDSMGVAGGGEQARGAGAGSGAGELVLRSQVRQALPCIFFFCKLFLIIFWKYFPLLCLGPIERILPYFILRTELIKTSPCLEKLILNGFFLFFFIFTSPLCKPLNPPKLLRFPMDVLGKVKLGSGSTIPLLLSGRFFFIFSEGNPESLH